MVVLFRYIDLSGRELAKTQVDGRIGSGFFGGLLDDAITKAGEDIVKFAVTTFAAK